MYKKSQKVAIRQFRRNSFVVKKEGVVYKYQCPYCNTKYNSFWKHEVSVVICPQCGAPYYEKKFYSTGKVRYTTYSKFKKLKRIFNRRVENV